MEYNLTSYDRKVKTSINFPKELMKRSAARMRVLGIEHFSVYVRALIRRDTESLNPMSLKEFFGETPPVERQVNLEFKTQRNYVDQPRRYSGFVAGLCKRWVVLQWFRRQNIDYKRQ